MLLDIPYIIFDQLRSELLTRKNISLAVARFDKIHPVVSGNKLFKLHYFLESFYSGKFRSIKTFGGAYSNHLVATAFACHSLQIPCQGIVRGERPALLSPTLEQCLEYGMELSFVSRETYAALSGDCANEAEVLVIPEGGYHPLGAAGASLIMDAIP
ncbi:MAG: 1-aminocyclopropane-1-carboxylate deaminase/D-cysteine desulfhydrase, partial [Chitinophagaceae bacterium]